MEQGERFLGRYKPGDFDRKFSVNKKGEITENEISAEERNKINALRKERYKEGLISQAKDAGKKWESLLPQEKRIYLAQIIKRNLGGKEEDYSERLSIESNGILNPKVRLDDEYAPLILSVLDLRNVEDLYQALEDLKDENPDLEISIENDPEGKWIKYSVREKKT